VTLRIDPERNEIRALEGVAEWRGRRVLEIGCGEGRLTERLAGLGARIHAIDPDADSIRKARRRLPRRFAPRVRFAVGTADALEHYAESFDRVVYSWVF
jgi:2-polyprenyl-6-hydroxyphenyl methylase/3-demethylubiquinone-9 3-methyltransferase